MKCLKKDICILWIMTFTKIREQEESIAPGRIRGIHGAHFGDAQISILQPGGVQTGRPG